MNCSTFAYKADHPATPAADNVLEREKSYTDALVALVAVEKKDTDASLGVVSQWISSHAAKLGSKRVVLNSFVHLTMDPAPIGKAKSLLSQLAASVGATFATDLAPFGWHKSFDFSVLAAEGSQTYREF